MTTVSDDVGGKIFTVSDMKGNQNGEHLEFVLHSSTNKSSVPPTGSHTSGSLAGVSTRAREVTLSPPPSSIQSQEHKKSGSCTYQDANSKYNELSINKETHCTQQKTGVRFSVAEEILSPPKQTKVRSTNHVRIMEHTTVHSPDEILSEEEDDDYYDDDTIESSFSSSKPIKNSDTIDSSRRHSLPVVAIGKLKSFFQNKGSGSSSNHNSVDILSGNPGSGALRGHVDSASNSRKASLANIFSNFGHHHSHQPTTFDQRRHTMAYFGSGIHTVGDAGTTGPIFDGYGEDINGNGEYKSSERSFIIDLLCCTCCKKDDEYANLIENHSLARLVTIITVLTILCLVIVYIVKSAKE